MPFAIADNAVAKAFQNIGNEWALLTAGDAEHFNTMTISWGSLGFIWQRPVVTVLVPLRVIPTSSWRSSITSLSASTTENTGMRSTFWEANPAAIPIKSLCRD